MILKDVEPFEAYDCKTGGCGYEGEAFDAYLNGMQLVLEDLDSAPEIDPESLLVVKKLRAEIDKLERSREMWRDRTRKLLADVREISEELEKTKKERDAAVSDVRWFVFRKIDACDYCKRNDPSNYTCTKNRSGYCDSWEYGVFNKWNRAKEK